MRILVGTPAGGGIVTTQWLLSFIATYSEATKRVYGQNVLAHLEAAFRNAKEPVADLTSFVQKTIATPKLAYTPEYDIGLYTLSNESLIGRGRNHLAQICLMQNWDKLIFIDSDQGWTWEQFKAVVDSPSPIIAGISPLKIYPISFNYFPTKEDMFRFHEDGQKSPENFFKMREHYVASTGSPEIEVDFMGTGFMCISRAVFLKLAESTPTYMYPNPATGQQETHWDFFNSSAVGDKFMSEDWGFCHAAREAGFKIKMNSDVVISHTGSHTFMAPTLEQWQNWRAQQNAISTNTPQISEA